MLDALVAVVTALLVLAGVLIMLGPQTASIVRRLRSIQRPVSPLRGPLARKGEAVPPGLLTGRGRRARGNDGSAQGGRRRAVIVARIVAP